MANALFGLGRQAFLMGDIHWDSDTIKAVFADSADYTLGIDTHDFLNDVATAARVPAGTDATQSAHPSLGTKTQTLGTADAADTTFTALTGDVVEYLILYVSTSTDTTSQLILNIDTATGLPLTPNGGDVVVAWDSGANKIFTL